MLLSLAPLECGDLTGILVLLHRQWTSSASGQAEDVIGSYREALFRLHNDTESTKPYLARLGSTVLSDLESASEICMRRLPDRFRRGCSLFTLAQDSRASKMRLHYKIPPWIHLTLVNEDQNAFEISGAEESAWKTFDEANGHEAPGPWRQALLNFFAPPTAPSLLQLQLPLPQGITHYRVAELIQRSTLPALAPCFSLALTGKKA
jgi:hypothetical protein